MPKKKLTPRQAAAALKADEQNRLDQALAKSKAKKPLTAAERKILSRYNKATPSLTTTQKYYDSIASAAAHLDIPSRTLRNAKKAGAPGFEGSRVYPDKLLPWLKKQDKAGNVFTDEKEQLEIRRLRGAIEHDEFEFAKERGEYVAKSELIPALQKLATDLQALLRQKLENEYPSAVTSLEPAQARVYGKRLVDAIYKDARNFADSWKF